MLIFEAVFYCRTPSHLSFDAIFHVVEMPLAWP
jgi:hypothetical protein